MHLIILQKCLFLTLIIFLVLDPSIIMTYSIRVQISTSAAVRNWTTAILWAGARTCSARSSAHARTVTGTRGSGTLSAAAGLARRATRASAIFGANASSRPDSRCASEYHYYYTPKRVTCRHRLPRKDFRRLCFIE